MYVNTNPNIKYKKKFFIYKYIHVNIYMHKNIGAETTAKQLYHISRAPSGRNYLEVDGAAPAWNKKVIVTNHAPEFTFL